MWSMVSNRSSALEQLLLQSIGEPLIQLNSELYQFEAEVCVAHHMPMRAFRLIIENIVIFISCAAHSHLISVPARGNVA